MAGFGRGYQAPVINRVAPNQRDTRWDEISAVGTPFAGDPAPSQFGFWFNYFWAEATGLAALTVPQKVKLAEVFFSIFQGGPGNYQLRPDFQTKDASFKENALRQVLLIGFKRVALDPPSTAPRAKGDRVLAPPPLTAVDASQLNFASVLAGSGDTLPIGFRSDLRSYDELVQHGGFKTRARSFLSQIYGDYALNQAWHPFNNPVYSNSLFLRMGEKNKDNCLHTVISVGAKFAEITHFPILNDVVLVFQAKSADGRFLAYKPFDEWTDQDIQAALGHRQKPQAIKGADGLVDRLEKVNHIHVFHLKGVKGYNTQAHFGGTDSFPERGMEQVPPTHLLADIQFVQKWFYEEKTERIQLYELDFAPIRWVPSVQAVEQLLGKEGFKQIHALVTKEIMLAAGRNDIAIEKAKYLKQKAEKPFRFTSGERAQMLTAWKQYITTFKPTATVKSMTSKSEKEALIAVLPLLRDKINKVSPLEWSELRNQAKSLR